MGLLDFILKEDVAAVKVSMPPKEKYKLSSYKHIRSVCITSMRNTSYPVGCHMESDLKQIKLLAEGLYDHCEATSLNLWCRGSSGAIIAGITASELISRGLHVKISHIKKPNESSHSSVPEFWKGPETVYVIIDDIVSSGNTVMEICRALSRYKLPNKLILAITGTINPKDALIYIGSDLTKIISSY
tara:strand:- start:738 stop:1298 length:561 start_codon:yes stop_codon:yes gene_type:complete